VHALKLARQSFEKLKQGGIRPQMTAEVRRERCNSLPPTYYIMSSLLLCVWSCLLSFDFLELVAVPYVSDWRLA
jgi:hypothetical protein